MCERIYKIHTHTKFKQTLLHLIGLILELREKYSVIGNIGILVISILKVEMC